MITLQPWGCIEGSVVLDSQPVANESVRAANHVFGYDERGRQVWLLTVGLDTKTDSAGKFSFEKVAPGECTVFREKASPTKPGSFFASHAVFVVVNPGAVAQVVLGGTGRPIIGTAHFAGAHGEIDWQSVPVRLRLKLANASGPYPRRHNFSSNEAFIATMDKWDQARRGEKTF